MAWKCDGTLWRDYKTADQIARDREVASEVHRLAGEIPSQPRRNQIGTKQSGSPGLSTEVGAVAESPP